MKEKDKLFQKLNLLSRDELLNVAWLFKEMYEIKHEKCQWYQREYFKLKDKGHEKT